METITLKKEDAARLAVKYWGCDVELDAKILLIDNTAKIDDVFLKSIRIGFIKSFQIQLRSIKEMTEAEKKEYLTIRGETLARILSYNPYKYNTPESIDYLRKIGVKTSEDDDKLIVIE